MDGTQGGPAAAVDRLLPLLAPLAVLLADDRDGAVRLLSAALSRPGALDDPAAARRALTGAATRTPRWAAEQVIDSLPPAVPVDDDTDEDVVLAAALRSLPAGTRASAVLQLLDDDSPAGAEAAALGAAVARGDAAERQDRERDRAAFRAPGSAPAAAPVVVPLDERLHRLAAGRPLPPTAAQQIAAALTTTGRTRRRRRLRWAGGAVVVALLLALVPLLPERAEPVPPADVYAGATRGSLARDADFLRDLRAQSWSGTDLGTTSPPARRRVVFAADVPGGRWALVLSGEGTADSAAAWFTGPAGAPAGRLRLRSVVLDPDRATPVSLTDPATGALVVVAARGDAVTVSERPEVTAAGSLTRDFTELTASDGVAVTGLRPLPGAQETAVRVRVERAGRPLDVGPPTVAADLEATAPEVPLSRLRAEPPPAVGDGAVAPRLATVLAQLGRSATDTPVTVLWSGDLPGPNDRPARLALLALQQLSGAVVVTAPFGYAADLSGRAGSSWCATGVLPAGPPLADRVVAVSCDISDATVTPEVSRFLVVVAPPSATSVELFGGADPAPREHAMTDGVAVVRSPGDVSWVRVHLADGSSTDASLLVETDLAG